MKVRPMWTLEEALALVQSIQQDIRAYNYHVALAGGVLNYRESKKDLDLIFVPMNGSIDEADPSELILFLNSLWGEELHIGSDYNPINAAKDANCYRYKLKFHMPKRIDAFIV